MAENTNPDIKVALRCINYAPFSNLTCEIPLKSLKFCIYADNGAGKTFLSKAFQLTESKDTILSDDYISFGENSASVEFKIKDGANVIDSFNLSYNKGQNVDIELPSKYIFHTFNQSYVEENLRSRQYDKEGEIDGYILGKTNIDISEENGEKNKLEATNIELMAKLTKEISLYKEKLNSIPNIRRLNEYSILSVESIIESIMAPVEVAKDFDDYMSDYDKIKSIPEAITPIQAPNIFEYDDLSFKDIDTILKQKFSISSFAEKFKEKMQQKGAFIEEGLRIKGEHHLCPFCEQDISAKKELIDQYVAYFNNEEAQTIKILKNYIAKLQSLKSRLNNKQQDCERSQLTFCEYTTKYISTINQDAFTKISYNSALANIDRLIQIIENKISNISVSQIADKEITVVDQEILKNNDYIKSNGQHISLINKILADSSAANREIRRNLCRALSNDIKKAVRTYVLTIQENTRKVNTLAESIKIKQMASKTKKRDKVADVISKILDECFRGKYTFNRETFLLKIKNNELKRGQANIVLSDGEKSVVAFAYYLGDVFLKIEDEVDYDRLFFVIDDPISSMDFNYVYVISSIIRRLREYIPISSSKKERFMIFTHNMEFLRILSVNQIVNSSYRIKNNTITKFTGNFSIPYIVHLWDIYAISEGKALPNHTTANSVRHILETLNRFEDPNKDASIEIYIRQNFPDDQYSYTLIQDLSHGAWRSEQPSVYEDDYIEICKRVIQYIKSKYPGQITYCDKL